MWKGTKSTTKLVHIAGAQVLFENRLWLVSGHPQADIIVYTFQNETIQVFFLLLLESTGGKLEEITQILSQGKIL